MCDVRAKHTQAERRAAVVVTNERPGRKRTVQPYLQQLCRGRFRREDLTVMGPQGLLVICPRDSHMCIFVSLLGHLGVRVRSSRHMGAMIGQDSRQAIDIYAVARIHTYLPSGT